MEVKDSSSPLPFTPSGAQEKGNPTSQPKKFWEGLSLKWIKKDPAPQPIIDFKSFSSGSNFSKFISLLKKKPKIALASTTDQPTSSAIESSSAAKPLSPFHLPPSEKERLTTESETNSEVDENEITSEVDEEGIRATWRDVEDSEDLESLPDADKNAPLVKDFIKQEQAQQASEQDSKPAAASLLSEVSQKLPEKNLKAVDPWKGLTATEREEFQRELPTGKLISTLGSSKIDTAGVQSLPECILYQLINVPTKNAAAIFWDLEALHPTAPDRLKTSEIKKLNFNTTEALFETSVGVMFMASDISRVTTQVEPVAGDGYLFTWSLSSGKQDGAYTKASNGSLLLLPYEGKTLLAYKAISTLKNNTFYSTAAKQIKGKIIGTVEGIVKAIAQGQEKPQKLQEQVSALEAACG